MPFLSILKFSFQAFIVVAMDEQTVETRIHATIQRLTAAEKRAARGLLANYPTIGLAPVAEFAVQSGASAATVLRFVAQLGFRSYPDFQRALREELDERVKSPLQRGAGRRHEAAGTDFLGGFLAQLVDNIQASGARIPASEFEAASRRLADARAGCHIAGGRFTDAMAAYLEAHLRIVRPGVRRLDGRTAARSDQLLDIRAGDTVVIFDIRRYDPALLDAARQIAGQRGFIILITDEWISPVSRHAKVVIPCRTGVDRTWDANTSLLALTEALIARVTELSWPTASKRIGSREEP